MTTDSTSLFLGSWLNSGSSIVAELMAASGLDFVTIDMEHSPVGITELAELLRAIRSGSAHCKALVRTPGPAYEDLKRYLDAGADGVIVPLVNDAETAQAIINAVKYPPQGNRGVGFARDNGYGTRLLERLKEANEQSFVCVQIEHIEAIQNLSEILAVPGLNAAFLGPYDLSASMGIPGEFEHHKYQEACRSFLKGCQQANLLAGIHVVPPDPQAVLARQAEGYRMIAYSLDITLLTSSLSQGLQAIRGGS
jgi:2-dehydro-3-deoxyglucarate aldolase